MTLSETRRVAVIGDVSGHLAPFVATLSNLGVDAAARKIPRNLAIVQVGDLVHRGPTGNQVVELVNELMQNNPPDAWIQLLGNHEAMHLGGPVFGNDAGETLCNCSDATVSLLQTWYNTNVMRCALAIRARVHTPKMASTVNEWLLTHAGLGHAAWTALGRPRTATHAAQLLNAQLYDDPTRAHAAGAMLRGIAPTPNIPPGVLWADCINEIYIPWYNATQHERNLPSFGQLHGHSSPVYWRTSQWIPTSREYADRRDFNTAARHSCVTIGNAVFVGVDPCFSTKNKRSCISPFLLVTCDL